MNKMNHSCLPYSFSCDIWARNSMLQIFGVLQIFELIPCACMVVEEHRTLLKKAECHTESVESCRWLHRILSAGTVRSSAYITCI